MTEREERIERLLERVEQAKALAASAVNGPGQPTPPTPTTLAPTAPNDVPVPEPTQQDQSKTDATQPTVRYFAFTVDPQGQPVGMFRQVFGADGGLTLHKVDKNGKWVEDNSLLNDIGPLSPDDADDSRWSWADEVPEEDAKRLYGEHFSGQKPTASPTATQQSVPANGPDAATPPNFGDTLDKTVSIDTTGSKEIEYVFDLGDEDPFYAGLGIKARIHVRPYMREGHLVGAYDATREGAHPGGVGREIRVGTHTLMDTVSVHTEPAVHPEIVHKLNELGLHRDFDEIPKSQRAKSLVGTARDTQNFYKQDGEYTPARKAVHEKILAKMFEGHKPAPQDERTVLFMAGGTASGKTTALKADPSLSPPDAVEINPDDIKFMLPEWDHLVGGDGPPAADAAGILHEESSDIAKEAMRRAQEGGYNIVLDGTGDSGPGKFLGKIEAAKKAGYNVDVVMVDAPFNDAVGRMVSRGERERRFVPVPEMRRVHAGSILRMRDWMGSGSVRRWTAWRTGGGKPTLVASGGGGKPETIHHHGEWDAMQEKAHVLSASAGAH